MTAPLHRVPQVALLILACAFAHLAFAQPALAAGDADAAKGIVAEHCVGCHDIPRYNPGGGLETVDAPPFADIADDPETYTAERLSTFLRRPHHPMTQYVLSTRDIENLIAFIQSLHQQ